MGVNQGKCGASVFTRAVLAQVLVFCASFRCVLTERFAISGEVLRINSLGSTVQQLPVKGQLKGRLQLKVIGRLILNPPSMSESQL